MSNFGHSKFLPVFLHLKGLNKFRMPIFSHSKFLPVILYQKGFNKFGMHIFGHSKFMPVFLRKIVRKNSEHPFLAILNLYQSFWEKLSGKMWNGHFWPFKIVFWKKLLETIWNGHFWPFQIYTSLLGKIVEKTWNSHFWPF